METPDKKTIVENLRPTKKRIAPKQFKVVPFSRKLFDSEENLLSVKSNEKISIKEFNKRKKPRTIKRTNDEMDLLLSLLNPMDGISPLAP